MSNRVLLLTENSDRIGHLFLEPYLALHDVIGPEADVTVGLQARQNFANPFVLELLQRYYRVEFLNVHDTLREMEKQNKTKMFANGVEIRRWDDKYMDVFAQMAAAGVYPKFRYAFTEEDNRRGADLLDKMGIPGDAGIVTLHNREAGYLPHLSYHSMRDGDIMDFIPAIEFLVSRGYWVVRIGDPSMKKLPPMEQVIDLPFSEYRNPFSDIWLIVQSRYFIGNTSGPTIIPGVFGKPPRLLLNYINAPPWNTNPNDRYQPKLLYSGKLKRIMSLKEMSYPGIISNYDSEYTEKSIEVLSNSPEDILLAVEEMESRLAADVLPKTDGYPTKQYASVMKEIHNMKQLLGLGWDYYLTPGFSICESFLNSHPELLA